MKSFIATVLFCLGIQMLVLAQMEDPFFSANHGVFLDELEKYMTANKRPSLIQAYEGFEKSFSTFETAEVDTIISTSNKMRARKMNASPFFENYLNCLVGIKTAATSSTTLFSDWHNILDDLLTNEENKSTKPYSAYLAFSKNFFKQGFLVYSKSGTSWYTTSANYKLKYDNHVPSVLIEDTDLISKRKNDSIQIRGTSGEFFPTTRIWEGRDGLVKWNDRFEELKEEVYAEIPGTFTIDLSKGLYTLNNVKLYYPRYFGNKKIVGTLTDKVFGAKSEAPYPAFESNEKVLEIDKIGNGIFFKGGFRMNGLTIYGYGTAEEPSQLEVYENDRDNLLFKGTSELVIIKREESLLGDQVQSTIFFRQDSLFHPSVKIRFNIKDKSLQLRRGDRGSDRNPFFSSYHNMNIDVEKVDVFFAQDSIVIGTRGIASGRNPDVEFESLKFFNKGEFLRYDRGARNPLPIMYVLSKKKGTKVLEADTLAYYLNRRFKESEIQTVLFELLADGFIDYSPEKHIIQLKDKLFHYVEANQDKVDYDYLKVVSSTKNADHASMNLHNGHMIINGVNNIEFSAAQRVAIKPDRKEVQIEKNRDMRFDGKLFAGYSILFGKGFKFNYDRFLIELDSVEYFDLFIPGKEKDAEGNLKAVAIDSRIEGLNGVLLIDAPSNKSGRDSIKMFPSFQSKKSSYVYYENAKIQEGVYKRDSFYFELDKFSFNQLDELEDRDIKFRGDMYSADIFPVFEEELVVREVDQSLGFEHETPAEGYQIYRDRANFEGIADLSNRGLLGKGNLTYLGAAVQSDDVVFRPKRLQATAEAFFHKEDRDAAIETPQVEGVKVAIDFKPYKDSMYITTEEQDFDLFQEGTHKLKGTIVLSPGGIKGKGKFSWDKAIMNSKLFDFGAFSATADTSSIAIKTLDGEEMAMRSASVKADVDFDAQKGNFKVNKAGAMTALPFNKYETSMDAIDWDIETGEIQFNAANGQLKQFLSVHPEQDSLVFEGENARYQMSNNELTVEGVPYIQASDAFIYPDSNRVIIEPNANIKKLENARIVANTVNKNHVINRATVKIEGKRVYKGSGFYEYNIGDRKQEIAFSDIQGRPVGKGKYKDKETVTRASGEIKSRDTFYIDQKTLFQGNISLSAESKNLQFDGFAKLEGDKIPSKSWFRVKFEGDKSDLLVKIDAPKNPEGIPLGTGLFLSKQHATVYPSLTSTLYFRKDRPILSITGLLDYDPEQDMFIYADSTKMFNKDAYRGNKMTFDNKTGRIEGEGKLTIGSDLKYVSMKSAGTIKTLIVPVDSTREVPNYPVTAEVMSAIDIVVPDKVLNIMMQDFKAEAPVSQAINFLREPDFYKKAIADLFPADKAIDEAIEGIGLGSLNIPNKYDKHTFVFAKLPLKWNPDYQSFVSQGDKLGVATINGQLLNYVYKGYVECRMPSGGNDDRLYIYLESPSGFNYYFGYKQGILSITSNNNAFIDAAEQLKPKELVLKMDDGETYEIQVVSPSSVNRFINRVKAAQ